MRSSAGSRNPERRAPLWLAGLACAAFALALGLAFVVTVPRPDDGVSAPSTVTVERRFDAPVERAPEAPQRVDVPENPLWALLRQWTWDAGSLAVFGLAVVLVVRSARRRGAQP